jgi:hypothetical protein
MSERTNKKQRQDEATRKRSTTSGTPGDTSDMGRGTGSDGYGAAGAGREHTRGAHARGERPDTSDDRHPGSGWVDPSTGPSHTRESRNATPDAGRNDRRGETTNRPGGNPQVEPRTDEKTKSYDRGQETRESRGVSNDD